MSGEGGAGSSRPRERSRTRSGGPVYDPDLIFPANSKFQPVEKLPTNRSVICMVRYFLQCNEGQAGTNREGKRVGRTGVTERMAIREVAKQVSCKWYVDTVCCLSLTSIERRVAHIFKIFSEGKKRMLEVGKENSSAVVKYKEFVDQDKDKLFDVFQEDRAAQLKLQQLWGVTMSPKEFLYYEDQKSDRKMYCSRGVDPVYECARLKAERLRERHEEDKEARARRFNFMTMEEVEATMVASGDIPTPSSDNSSENVEDEEVVLKERETEETEVVQTTGKKRKRSFQGVEDLDDPLPKRFRHIRDSERKVKDEFYKTVANLSGAGLSVNESSSAVVLVGNGMFGRSWKKEEDTDIIDLDTTPSKRSIVPANRMIEAQSLSLAVGEVEKQKEEGRMVTHAMDSTTKKGVGQFAVQGLHIGQGSAIPLPILPIHGETTEDIATQVDMGMMILAATRGCTTEEVYSLVDAHMGDSVQHNKGYAVILQELYSLETPAGQYFCGTHTTLGFAAGMNKMLRNLEAEMKTEQVLKGFMVDLEIDSKNSSLAGQALDICLKLVAGEYAHKPWNRYKEFQLHLEQIGVSSPLFAYKDSRFGCLSRAAAVLLHIYPHLVEYLDLNPGVNNRLACLAREVLSLPYLKPVLAAVAFLGVNLVEPFYARTIEKGATHSQLKQFYKDLYSSMNPVSEEAIYFNKPQFLGVSNELFCGVKKSYGEDVLQSVTEVAGEHTEEVVKLINIFLPEMKTVLARQRRDYNIDEERFPPQYPVEEQVSNPDDTPVHNIGMERLCGQVDYRLHKLRDLQAVSRSIILQKAQQLREGEIPSFRGFKEQAEAKRELELSWSNYTKKHFEKGSDEKKQLAQRVERKRLDTLDALKKLGGPFTDATEVELFLSQDLAQKERKLRLKLELQFARDSSTLLPQRDQLFRVQITLPTGKRRDKTPEEFGDALMCFLGKKSDRTTLDYTRFQESLQKLDPSTEEGV